MTMRKTWMEICFWAGGIGLMLVLSVMGARGAGATLIDEGTTVLDDTTNLRWLKSGETVGLSFLQAAVLFPDYRYASGDEVCGLLVGSGTLTPDPCPGSGTAVLGNSVQPILTAFASGGTAMLALYEDGNGDPTLAGLAAVGLVGEASVASVEPDRNDINVAMPGVSVAMVQVVPEPFTGAMLGLGLVGLGLAGRRRL